ncbi:MAG: FAD-dependent monooxygenase [Brachybacterium sp.]|uniref:FAD-dependent oxidoreductase n=1 Tax=Brachybacterium sp. TaxID=1891286 RepID=UPI0026479161|nr:NAD(P)/FAD-dependent oxidoreductase [Brachybacterium sp.]MDN5687067.1 FAD-dependent monooxygenase [Brachybacterium sp.]
MTVPTPGPEVDVRCEVLIVGGGPTGLFLAALLTRRGVDVLVLERRTAPAEHSRAIGLHPPALRALREVGLETAAARAGARIRCGRARSRGRELGRLRFARAWPGRPYVLSLPQSRTEAMLAERLNASAPGALRRGWEVTALRERADGVEVTARATGEVAETGPSTDTLRLHARVAVAADGSRSTVRELLGIGTTGAEHRDTYLMGDLADPDSAGAEGIGDDGTGTGTGTGTGIEGISAEGTDPCGVGTDREALIHLEPGGVVESFPLPGARRRWVAHTGRGDLTEPDPEVLTRTIRERIAVRLDPATTSMISVFSVRRRTAQRLVTTRCVLLGDAAHEISPIGGQGITLGWLGALDAAPLLARTVRGTAGGRASRGPLDADQAWQSLERVCRRRARVAGLLAHANTALGRPLPGPLAAVRSLGVSIALRTPLRHVMAWTYSMGWARRR